MNIFDIFLTMSDDVRGIITYWLINILVIQLIRTIELECTLGIDGE